MNKSFSNFHLLCTVKQKNKKAGNSQRPPKDYGACLVTRHILDDGKPVGFMYREQPEDDFDSGWRFLSGEEDEHYMADEQNAFITDVDMVIVLDPAIKKFLHLPFGTELERKGDSFIPYQEEE